ncbi:UNVERIFIED_CONTAM: hypothetical protein FKN15_034422 [Acipenser sinensis]
MQQPQQQQEEVKDTEEVHLKAKNPERYDQPSPVCPLCEQKHLFADCHFRYDVEQEWRKVPEHPQPRREETEPFLSSEEMLDWVSDPEWNWEDLPKVVDLLWARDGEHWERWEQHYFPVPFVNPAAVVINYLAADMGLSQQVDFQVGGASPTCTLTGLEGKCLLSTSPPA